MLLFFSNEIQFKVSLSGLISCYIITHNISWGTKMPKSKIRSKLQEDKLCMDLCIYLILHFKKAFPVLTSNQSHPQDIEWHGRSGKKLYRIVVGSVGCVPAAPAPVHLASLYPITEFFFT